MIVRDNIVRFELCAFCRLLTFAEPVPNSHEEQLTLPEYQLQLYRRFPMDGTSSKCFNH